jgi:hypothetical protein
VDANEWEKNRQAWEDSLMKLQEQDRYGKDQHETGAKNDAGKSELYRFLRQLPYALRGVVGVMMYGRDKYTEGGWQDVPDADVRYRDAMLRHGLPIDGTHDVSGPDPSGFLHTAQLACNALFALELELRQGIPLRVPVDAKKSD